MKLPAKLIRVAIHEAGITLQSVAQNDDRTVEDQFDSLPAELQRWVIEAPIARFPVLLEQQNAKNVASNKEVNEALVELQASLEGIGQPRERSPEEPLPTGPRLVKDDDAAN